jgi:dolichyl-phosphate-mannose-protein mannosyltransferase
MKPAELPDRSRLEWLAVAVVAAIGAGLRAWPIGRLGLDHFDEGIYALVATWSLQPRGLAALDPTLIPYAPPGLPILGGLAYAVLGRSDGAMIAVSQLAGTLTIPVVAWLSRRTFGAGSGFAAATFCAFSGPHIAFSRMALTDASFLLAWLLAIGAGMRFLDRPGAWRAIVLGLAVGLAQQFKYNGWLAGGIVVGSAALGIGLRSDERKARSILRTFGWGGLAVGVAWLVVWPWYAFVEAHGGYPALLRHQQSYLGGFRAWWPNLQIQSDQAAALSGGDRLILSGLALACLTPWLARPPSWVEATKRDSRPRRLFLSLGIGFVPWLLVPAPCWLGLILAPWLLTRALPSMRLVGVWWLVFAVMTPLYHPYARLWLPFHAANWLLMGWLVANGLAASRALGRNPAGSGSELRQVRLVAPMLLALTVLGGFVSIPSSKIARDASVSGLLAPSDSLDRASAEVASILPEKVKGLRLLARPPVAYYLAGRVALYPMSGADQLADPGDPRFWVLVDSAILRSELGTTSGGAGRNLLDRFANHWDVVEEFPTTLTLPTWLDLDPGASRSGSTDRSSPLWLLRPRRPGAPR